MKVVSYALNDGGRCFLVFLRCDPSVRDSMQWWAAVAKPVNAAAYAVMHDVRACALLLCVEDMMRPQGKASREQLSPLPEEEKKAAAVDRVQSNHCMFQLMHEARQLHRRGEAPGGAACSKHAVT